MLGAGIHAVRAIVTEGLNRELIEPLEPTGQAVKPPESLDKINSVVAPLSAPCV